MTSRIAVLFLLLPFFSLAQNGNGISFAKKTWSELLTQAKKEKKIIFVDAFTTWCGPCKKMASDVFTDNKVGAFYNQNFINAKIDMEAGEGISLSERYDVTAYPTLLFINGDGKLLHKAIGYQEADQFIATGRDALDPGKQFYTLQEAFKKGSLNEEQLYRLALGAIQLDDASAGLYAESYLKNKKNCLTKPCIELMLAAAQDVESPYFKWLSQNEKTAGETLGNDEVRDGLNRIAYASAIKTEKIGQNEPIRSAMVKVENGMKKHRPAREARRFALGYGLYLAGEADDAALTKELEARYLTEFADDFGWSELNEYAWNAYLNETDKAKLQEALKWGLLSVSKESNFYNNDTVAHLYYKLGNKKEARNYAETALRMGKEAGEDVKETEELLKKL